MATHITDNRSILQKADLTTPDLGSGAGELLPEQAQAFIKIAIKESVLLGQVTVRPMRRDKERIEKIRFGSRVLRNASEGIALPAADRVKPDLSKVELE
jgi:hypothetical protein